MSTGNQSDVRQLSATHQVLTSKLPYYMMLTIGRDVTMLENVPELVSSYTIKDLLEIDETSL